MEHHALLLWESRLKKIFVKLDEYLEEKYGQSYPLHPARAQRGSTANNAYDGLFNVGASFSAGIGSRYGPGYVVEVRMVTLSHIPEKIRVEIEDFVVEYLQRELPVEYPERELHVARDGEIFKIYGDLSLGIL
ncbi:MAG: hypothetical protein GH155_04140 [Spirochaeta sp.]|nr:hypothetical protein [Spirochaeta sp.]